MITGAILGALIVLLVFVCLFLLGRVQEQRKVNLDNAAKLGVMCKANEENAKALAAKQQAAIASFTEKDIFYLANLIVQAIRVMTPPGKSPTDTTIQ